METEEEFPIKVIFEIVRLPEPNNHWFEVTAILSWEARGFSKRMETCLVLQSE